jgi:hypothetical protein
MLYNRNNLDTGRILMEITKKKKVELLEWFLNFTKADLQGMDRIERKNTLDKAIQYFLDPIMLTSSRKEKGKSEGLDKARGAVELHNLMNELLFKLQRYEHVSRESSPYQENEGNERLEKQVIDVPIIALQQIQKEFLEIFTSFRQNSCNTEELEIILSDSLGPKIFYRSTRGDHEAFLVFLIDEVADFILSAKIHLRFVLGEFKGDNILECQECGIDFVHTSLKPRFYCNPKCTSKAIAKKHRLENPEEYRKKHRELLRRLYNEKKEARNNNASR